MLLFNLTPAPSDAGIGSIISTYFNIIHSLKVVNIFLISMLLFVV
jgi:hypothetical protein